MITALRLHPDALYIIIGTLAVVAAIIVAGVILPPWIRGIRYARTPGGHKRERRLADPVWDAAETAAHDTTWDDALAGEFDDFAPEHAAPCSDPYCSQMTHDGTGQMPAVAPKHALMPLPDWHTQDSRPTVTVGLPPWEGQERADGREDDARDHRGPGWPVNGAPSDLPGPDSLDGDFVRANRAGEPRRKRSMWTGLLGRDPIVLPVAEPETVPAAPPPSTGAPAGGGEPGPDIIVGVIVDPSAAAYDADTWFAEQMAALAAWSAAEQKTLRDWSRRELVPA